MTTPNQEIAPSDTVKRKRRLLVTIGVVLATFGPGLVSANAGNDAGGILTYASAGAQFGYRTLFLMVVVTVGLVVVQEMSSRLGVYTGQGLGGLIREQFSAPSTFAAMLMLLIANAGLTVSEFAGVGAAMGILGVSRYLSIPVAAVLVWITTVLGSYSKAERLFLVLSLAFLAYPVAAVLGHPNGQQVLDNLVWPHFLSSHSFLVLAVALIGTTITPYMQFYVASAVVDKGVLPKDYRKERFDTVSGGDLERYREHLHHHRHSGGHRWPRAARDCAGCCSGASADCRIGRTSAVRRGPARRVVAGGLRRPALHLLRNRRCHRSPEIGVSQLQGCTAPLRDLHTPDPRRGRRVLRTGEPGIASDRRPGTERPHYPDTHDIPLILTSRRSVLGSAVNGPRFLVVAIVSVAIVGTLAFVVLLQTVLSF